MESANALKAGLLAQAHALGFDACRVTHPDVDPRSAERLKTWIEAGSHGTMAWMADTEARRGSPRALWPDVRAIVMLGMNYAPESDPLADLADKRAGIISVYARHRDYHDVLKGRLKALAAWLARQAPSAIKVFVDTAPVMEKPLAAGAGLGWQGKHTNLVSRDFGSWLFLGSIFTTLALPPDAPETDHCGSCRACLDICPTQAFPAPYRIDARRCISYLTIEHKGPIAREFRAAIGNRIYGCDDCLAVCPWNKFAETAREAKFLARRDLDKPALADLARLDDAAFRRRFSGGPVKRIGSARFLRNVLIAIGNSGDPGLAECVLEHLSHVSPLVRGMAVWALGRLLPGDAIRARAEQFSGGEDDEMVVDEWRSVLALVQD